MQFEILVFGFWLGEHHIVPYINGKLRFEDRIERKPAFQGALYLALNGNEFRTFTVLNPVAMKPEDIERRKTKHDDI